VVHLTRRSCSSLCSDDDRFPPVIITHKIDISNNSLSNYATTNFSKYNFLWR